jgi:hypothetical protein
MQDYPHRMTYRRTPTDQVQQNFGNKKGAQPPDSPFFDSLQACRRHVV